MVVAAWEAMRPGSKPATPSDMRDTQRVARSVGVPALRDLGGRDRAAGAKTPFGVFFRSGTLDHAGRGDWDALYEGGVRTVVDLRRPDELAPQRDRPGWLTTVNVDLDGFENVEFWSPYLEDGRIGTPLYYAAHLQAMPERATEALTAIVTAQPGAVLFHCAGGRDRTGLISMLLLAAADVTVEAMTADYLETARDVELLNASRPSRECEITVEEVARRNGTTIEDSFRSAANALNLDLVLDAGGMSEADRGLLYTWRGSLVSR